MRPIYLEMIMALLFDLTTLGRTFAYLDPGSGSYFLQLLVASLMGGIFALGIFRKKVIAFFKKLFSSQNNDEDHDSP
jgi:hypothetical protein